MKQPEELNAEFELQLTEALRSVAPPEGFADRVLAHAHSPAPASAKVIRMPLRARPWVRGMISGAIAAGLLVGVYTGQQAHQRYERHERQRAERAQQQFDAGIRITDRTLEHVRVQLQQAGIPAGD